MLESIQQRLNQYIPSKKEVKIFAAKFVFETAVRLALEATECALISISEAVNSQTSLASSNHEIPPNSQKV